MKYVPNDKIAYASVRNKQIPDSYHTRADTCREWRPVTRFPVCFAKCVGY